MTTEERVREYFKDEPALAEIAYCESRFRQFEEDGLTPFRGVVNRADVGVMQINEHFHLKESKNLGIDIYTLEGNLEYAKHIYEKYGTKPWKASSPCWKNRIVASK